MERKRQGHGQRGSERIGERMERKRQGHGQRGSERIGERMEEVEIEIDIYLIARPKASMKIKVAKH